MAVEEQGRPHLINARKSKGISQVYIARKLGYTSSNQYSSMERNRNVTIKVGQALAIARMLGLTVEELFFDEEIQVS
ncbi:helix-turn-helix transcriptional regulator [Exiguobacterium antarcticum]|uniref:helix-turn-helix transcriptional regulator n=1 Tax=Exiguobacterium antarcticum TaxID=132920 RepID=UPI00047C5114|nr:helix-turn-helix transcriptional regulator [Exiguobacterium antarcticum]